MRTFHMVRKHDISGVSGTGTVLDGVEFDNGKVAVSWRAELDVPGASVGVYDSFDFFERVHITSHPTNETEVVWDD